MSRYVWLVKVRGGRQGDVAAAVERALTRLHEGRANTTKLDEDERAWWVDGVVWTGVTRTQRALGRTVVRVEAEVHGEGETNHVTAAMLHGGLDEEVLDEVFKIREVTDGTVTSPGQEARRPVAA